MDKDPLLISDAWHSNWLPVGLSITDQNTICMRIQLIFHFIHLFSLCLTNVAIVILQDTIDSFAKIKVNIIYYSSFVHSPLVTSSPKVFKLVRPSLSSMNPHWVFSITFLSFMCSEMTSQKAYSRTLLGPEARLSGMWWPGSSLLSLKMAFFQSLEPPTIPLIFWRQWRAALQSANQDGWL